MQMSLKQQMILVAACLFCVASQVTLAQTTSTDPSTQTRVYDFGSEVTPPELLPFSSSIPPDHCWEKVDGKVKLSVEIDPSGVPQKIMFIEPHYDGLDGFATQIASSDRFKPGAMNGTPVPVSASLELRIKSCLRDTVDAQGKKTRSLSLRELPEQTLGTPGHVAGNSPFGDHKNVGNKNLSAPVPLNSVTAQYSEEARRNHINGGCLVSVIVDKYGLPQNPILVKSLEPSLDANALTAAMQYRFKPALKDGTPIPVKIVVEINFKLM
jgi:TonB family protein